MLEIASDVTTASGTFAGLVLVFVGATLTSYERFDADQRPAVLTAYRPRAWLAHPIFARDSSLAKKFLDSVTLFLYQLRTLHTCVKNGAAAGSGPEKS